MVDDKFKLDFFKENSGWIKGILTVILLAVFGVIGWFVLPFAISVIAELIIFVPLVVVAICMLYLVTNGTLQQGVMLLLDNIALRMKNAVMEHDPFSTAQNSILRLERKKQQMSENVAGVRGAAEKLHKTIQAFDAKRNQALATAKVAQEQKREAELKRFANMAQLYLGSIKRLQPRAETAESFYKMLFKLLEKADIEIAQRKDELNITLEEYKITQQTNDAVQAAKSFMSGEELDNFNFSMDVIAQKTAAALGEVELFMDIAQPMMQAQDFEKDVKTHQALESFKQWLGGDTALFTAQEKKQMLAESGVSTDAILGNAVQKATQDPTATNNEPHRETRRLIDRME